MKTNRLWREIPESEARGLKDYAYMEASGKRIFLTPAHTSEPTDQIAAEAAERIGTHTDLESSTAIIKSAIEKATEPLLSILKEGASKNGLFKSACREAIANHESRAAHASEHFDYDSYRIGYGHGKSDVAAADASERQVDVNFQIPPEIMEAAYTVHNYAMRSGFKKGWCIGPIQDRT